MTSARLTNSAARERFRALRFNSRRSGGANTILLKSRQPGYQKSLNKSLIYCTRNAGQNDGKTIERCENDDETVLDMDVPKVSLNLVFRGEELPRLHSIYFTSGSNTSVAEAPQDRDLARAIAVALLLFALTALTQK